MTAEFTGKVWYWKGPSPFYFVSVPPEAAEGIKAIARNVTYGWGMVPVSVEVGSVEFTTALFPKDGTYVLPLKLTVRRKLQIEEDDVVTVRLSVVLPGGPPTSGRRPC